MKENLCLEIVSPESIMFSGEIEMVEMPGKQGRFAILSGHAPIISSLTEGSIRVKPQGQEEIAFPCKSGYVECDDNKVTILLNS
ncbi:MAG: ATP synthase F1 subunit epsilon [Bacteroidales bacterium]|jgi:F-type H+-transporting ATPase subunit epsilon|nr:ATP synthase F1 subunit epsilon [Bacteroidales bacterium]